ncbi:MAG TPA: dihydropteroate synthase [Acidimicrobiales bacterium]|nr:dihydropteroate synthase [Acidimicrobiales bacterium]
MIPLVMGVLNVTPDSFSDGGRWVDPGAAVAHGLEMARAGARVIDVGGESTRPGAEPVEEAEEKRRVVSVIEALAPQVRVSIDTRKVGVAEAGIEAGATLVNDVSATLWPVAAAGGAGWVAMHMQGDPTTMQADPRYEDVVQDVLGFVVAKAAEAADAGVKEIWIDPGFGFGKTPQDNLLLLRHIGRFVRSGFPVLTGTSRKSFLGRLSGNSAVNDRLEGSLATAAWAMSQGVSMVRVHDVEPTVQLARLIGMEIEAA